MQNYGWHPGALELWFFWTEWWVSRQLVQRRAWFQELFSVAPSPVLLPHLLSQARGSLQAAAQLRAQKSPEQLPSSKQGELLSGQRLGQKW